MCVCVHEKLPDIGGERIERVTAASGLCISFVCACPEAANLYDYCNLEDLLMNKNM